MSDQSPPGSPEPGSAGSSGPGGHPEPADPAVPRQSTGPAPSDQPPATGLHGPDQPVAAGPGGPTRPEADDPATGPSSPDPTAPGPVTPDPTAADPTAPGPAAVDPAAPTPGTPEGPAGATPPGPPGFTAPGGPPGFTAPGGPSGFTAPGGPSGFTAPGGPSGFAAPGGPSGFTAPEGPAGTPGQPWDPAAPGHVFPPTGGFPPGAGPYAGFPPGYPPYGGHLPYGWPGAGGWDPDDPLVNPPHAGVNGWFARCAGAVRRGWRLLVPLLFLTQVLPGLVLSLVSLALSPGAGEELPADGSLPDGFLGDLALFGSVVFLVSLLLSLVQCVGWAGGTWAVTRQAAGEPVDLGGAFRYGLRRALGLWGWQLLASLLVLVGICFFVLPGIYLAFALALAGPVYLFERQNPIGRSFRFFHDRLGLVLGRVGLVALALLAGGLIGFVLETVATAPFGADPFGTPAAVTAMVAVTVVSSVLTLPVQLIQLVGLVATYAEQRAQEGPVNAARLAAELG
ncbi:hypothetical protein AB0K04_15595 [Micromonospora coxensis]|uniref:hypothetical protein n=1 Tax=Micromonospora coxensis TaxID=356852 RepID=UPI0034437529